MIKVCKCQSGKEQGMDGETSSA